MLRQLHVALVYNLKAAVQSDGHADDGERMNDADGETIVAASVKREATITDTYAEWDTKETIDAVRTALEERHRVTLIEASEDAFQRFREVRPEIVFNIAEGSRGASREAQIPSMLEMLGIPYTGSDPVTLGLCLDKARAKEVLSYHHIPTPAFSVVSSLNDLNSKDWAFPAVVKPLHEGSSKGILNTSLVRNVRQLRAEVGRILLQYDQPALVERFLPGREFTVALLGNEPHLRVLPIVEIRLDSLPEEVNPIYSYEAKWIWDRLDNPMDVHRCPAPLDALLQKRIESMCRQAYHVLRCRDWCRIDLRLDEQGDPLIIELNPLPGILPNPEEHSCFPQAARAAGLSYDEMLNEVLSAAVRRYGID